MRVACLMLALAAVATRSAAAQDRPHFHHLAATPSTVAWGYYWAGAKPVLRVASGDTVEVETLITSLPDRLERAGVPASLILIVVLALFVRWIWPAMGMPVLLR